MVAQRVCLLMVVGFVVLFVKPRSSWNFVFLVQADHVVLLLDILRTFAFCNQRCCSARQKRWRASSRSARRTKRPKSGERQPRNQAGRKGHEANCLCGPALQRTN